RETMETLVKAVFLDPPPPIAQYRPDVPAGLGAVIEQALEKPLDRRFPNIATFAAALAPYAPPSALPYVQRIAKVQGVEVAPARPPDLPPLEPKAAPPPVSGPTPSTATVALTVTAAEAPAGRLRLVAIVALVLAGALVLALAVIFRPITVPGAGPGPSGT